MIFGVACHSHQAPSALYGPPQELYGPPNMEEVDDPIETETEADTIPEADDSNTTMLDEA